MRCGRLARVRTKTVSGPKRGGDCQRRNSPLVARWVGRWLRPQAVGSKLQWKRRDYSACPFVAVTRSQSAFEIDRASWHPDLRCGCKSLCWSQPPQAREKREGRLRRE